jgi:two-component sensor histidine kinase
MSSLGGAEVMQELGFDLSIDPNPRFVSVVRRFVEATVERLLGDPELVFRVSMTAHELMENAAKYSLGSKALLRVSFKREGDELDVSLYLLNETTPDHIERLRERIRNLAAAPDPFVHYQRLMKQNARSTDESGLGLARIRAEGEMSLDLEVKGNTVGLLANARVRKGTTR